MDEWITHSLINSQGIYYLMKHFMVHKNLMDGEVGRQIYIMYNTCIFYFPSVVINTNVLGDMHVLAKAEALRVEATDS
jgi:hypothetical protein